jgi:hypothetical protein
MFERFKFDFLAFVLFLESICKGQKKFGHSLGPSVNKKNQFPQMIVILCNVGVMWATSNTRLRSGPPAPTPPIADKMLTVLLRKHHQPNLEWAQLVILTYYCSLTEPLILVWALKIYLSSYLGVGLSQVLQIRFEF